jgi:hypothetical protein
VRLRFCEPVPHDLVQVNQAPEKLATTQLTAQSKELQVLVSELCGHDLPLSLRVWLQAGKLPTWQSVALGAPGAAPPGLVALGVLHLVGTMSSRCLAPVTLAAKHSTGCMPPPWRSRCLLLAESLLLAVEAVHVGLRERGDALGEVAHHLLAALEQPLVGVILIPAGELRRLHAGGGRERGGAGGQNAEGQLCFLVDPGASPPRLTWSAGSMAGLNVQHCRIPLW